MVDISKPSAAEKKTIQTMIDNALKENSKSNIHSQIFNPHFQQELRVKLIIEDCLAGIPDKKERAEKIIESFKRLEHFIISAKVLARIVLDIMEDL